MISSRCECRQRLDLVVQIDHPVVDVHTQFIEQLLVLGEGVLVEDLHRSGRRRWDGETFIIVALTCSENITPVLYASSICSS